MCLKYKAVSSFWWLQPVAASFWQIFSWAWLSNSNHTTVSRDSNHTVSNSKPAELLQQTTRGFQATGIVREYPDRGNSPHALSIREVLFHETGCHISVVKFTEKSARALLCARSSYMYTNKKYYTNKSSYLYTGTCISI